MKELEGEWIMKNEMRMISKDGTISNFPKYTSSKEEEEKKASEMGSNSEPPVTNNVNNANVNGGNGGNGGNDGNGRNSMNGGNNGCSYKTFLACNPRDYDGKGGAVALTRWIRK
uniref:Reverse transcriptase domain-containing protein n=1 Tax=Tanacetum cinerariifolium TaxID=118510 RepID=A0A699J3I2_TANCI|nr:reverse transcriptase domain-containing protein [Tanacetum cinerariifolium]